MFSNQIPLCSSCIYPFCPRYFQRFYVQYLQIRFHVGYLTQARRVCQFPVTIPLRRHCSSSICTLIDSTGHIMHSFLWPDLSPTIRSLVHARLYYAIAFSAGYGSGLQSFRNWDPSLTLRSLSFSIIPVSFPQCFRYQPVLSYDPPLRRHCSSSMCTLINSTSHIMHYFLWPDLSPTIRSLVIVIFVIFWYTFGGL